MPISWKSPSNIALVKYWGKHGQQLPKNASISFSLDAAHTITSLAYSPQGQGKLDFWFENQPNFAFRDKILKVLAKMPIFDFLKEYDIQIHSHNSFPHSAGIASSASSMSALVLCLCTMAQAENKVDWDDATFWQEASRLSRLASGSAARSVRGQAMIWGQTPAWQAASDAYAVDFSAHLHPVFSTYRDAILFVSRSEKSVSSTAGHALMDTNPFAEARYAQAQNNLSNLLPALQSGDIQAFGEILEEEALTLHALMMCSRPSFILLEPNSLELIQKVRAWRRQTNLPLYFTIDAGPNLHLLYPDEIHPQVEAFIQTELLAYCENRQYLSDIHWS